jgi:hypothetical protein
LGIVIPQEYVQARSVLLDALCGLGAHRDAVVLVGAQAVYLHSGDADFVTPPTTTDADLMVPEALSGAGGRRAAHLRPPHDDKATARRTVGLEPALVDNEVHVINALDGEDTRSFAIKVAGPAPLLVSKIIKVGERRDQPGRLKPKDGLDALRLLRAADVPRLARSLRKLASDELSSHVVERAIRELRELAREPEDILPTLAANAEAGFDDSDVIKMSMVVLVDGLLREFDGVT